MPPSTPSASPPEVGARLALADHLEELRRRLAAGLLALITGCLVGLVFADKIITWLRQPAGVLLERFAFFSPLEPLMAYLKVALVAGLAMSMPVLLWQAWAFVRPGLRPQERRYGLIFVGWGSVQFLLGAAVAQYLLLPVSLRILLGMASDVMIPVISIDRYLTFVTSLILACGLLFELPVVLVILARLGIVTSEWLRQQRPYAVLVLVITAAVVTPTTDPLNLMLMAVPLVLLYEASIHLARLAP